MSEGTSVEAALEAAVNATAESSTAAPVETPEVTPEQQAPATSEPQEEGTKTVPYERFQEVISAKNDALESLKSWEEQSKTWSNTELELREQLSSLREEADTLEDIRKLHKNPEYKDLIEKIDAKIRGVELQVESGDKSPEQGAKETADLLTQQRSELEEFKAEQNATLLLELADTTAGSMLQSLPPVYTESDKRRISAEWTDKVDWGKIEREGSSSIRPELANSLKAVLEDYGEPQGALKTKITELETKISEVEKVRDGNKDAFRSDEDVVQGLLSKEKVGAWDSEGNKPVISDAEVANDIKELLKRTNR